MKSWKRKRRFLSWGIKYRIRIRIGSAIGIYRMAKTLQKNVHIVLDEESTSVRQLLSKVREDPEYEKDMIINSEKALSLAEDKKAMLVVVDVNRPSYTECEELLKKLHTIVVIDHHRRMKGLYKIGYVILY